MLELTIIAGASPDNPTVKKKQFGDKGGIIGRDAKADWSLFDPSRIVSSQHAKVIFSQGAYYLSDLSANGIMTEQGQKLRKGEYRLLKVGEVYIIGPYHVEVAAMNQEDKEQAFTEAGLGHILQNPTEQNEALTPLDYVRKQEDPLALKDPFFDFPASTKTNTLKPFDFMPDPIDFQFGQKPPAPLPNQEGFVTLFCQLFGLNQNHFKGIAESEVERTIKAIFAGMAEKYQQQNINGRES